MTVDQWIAQNIIWLLTLGVAVGGLYYMTRANAKAIDELKDGKADKEVIDAQHAAISTQIRDLKGTVDQILSLLMNKGGHA